MLQTDTEKPTPRLRDPALLVISLALAPLITVKPPLNRWIAMFILYIGFSLISFGVARQLRDWIEKAQFVEYDRHLGALLGLVKGIVICLLRDLDEPVLLDTFNA